MPARNFLMRAGTAGIVNNGRRHACAQLFTSAGTATAVNNGRRGANGGRRGLGVGGWADAGGCGVVYTLDITDAQEKRVYE